LLHGNTQKLQSRREKDFLTWLQDRPFSIAQHKARRLRQYHRYNLKRHDKFIGKFDKFSDHSFKEFKKKKVFQQHNSSAIRPAKKYFVFGPNALQKKQPNVHIFDKRINAEVRPTRPQSVNKFRNTQRYVWRGQRQDSIGKAAITETIKKSSPPSSSRRCNVLSRR
jgi:hypothetical protein